jgi:hypothetical protein
MLTFQFLEDADMRCTARTAATEDQAYTWPVSMRSNGNQQQGQYQDTTNKRLFELSVHEQLFY